jgi:geranylgeranyl diphosphate synthase, type I
MLIDYLKEKKAGIDRYIRDYLDSEKKHLGKITPWGNDFIEKLKKFATLGKTIRGNLVFLSAEMFNYKKTSELLKLACGMELIHSSLLIHDDIMDNDLTRRGIPTIFASYLPLGSLPFAQSMGICAGDIGFFLSLGCFNNLMVEETIKTKLTKKFIDEMIMVGLAQMSDVYWGNKKEIPGLNDIEKIYLYKTARYTFSLPLSLGAIISNQNNNIINKIEKLGEYLGLIFQIKDDEIGLTGTEEEIGKPVGSDIRENKKTLIRYYLYQKANDKQKKYLDSVFGNKNIKKKDIAKVKLLVNELEILKIINLKINKLVNQSYSIIRVFPIEKTYQTLLSDLVKILTTRTR